MQTTFIYKYINVRVYIYLTWRKYLNKKNNRQGSE